MVVRLRKDETGHHRVHHRGDNTHQGRNNNAAWPTVCYLRKVHPTHAVTSWACPALPECALISHPLPWCAATKETDLKMYLSLRTEFFLSFLFLLCMPWNQGVTSLTFPEGCRIDLQMQSCIEARYRFPWEAKGVKLNSLKLVHLVKFQRKRANVRRCTWVLCLTQHNFQRFPNILHKDREHI